MRIVKLCTALVCCLGLLACTAQKMNTRTLPKGVVIQKGVQIPNTTVVRYYIPQNDQMARAFFERGGFWIEPGKGLLDGSRAAFAAYFPQARLLDINKPEDYGLLFDLQPEWKLENGKVILKMAYRVLAGDGTTPLLSGDKSFSATYDVGGGTGFYNAALRATQLMLIDILNQLAPNAEKFPANHNTAAINPTHLANMEKPVSLGTGFYFNKSGQLLTANHVLNDCLVIRVGTKGQEIDAQSISSSALLDLAVLSTHTASPSFLPLRRHQELVLGEMVSSVGYPLQGLLAETPNLTRGNVSAKSGMKGSLGLFQFSAPIQPGTSGGPIISESGQLLGVAVSTLNSRLLIEKGILPQNVNFGLDAKYVAQFLRKHQLTFVETGSDARPNIQTSNDAALAASVRVACYQ